MSGALHLGIFEQPEKAFIKNMKKLIIAHRGATSPARENTLEAFQKAIDLRADMIEFDVRRTQDRHHVIHHDPHIAGRPLNEMTLREVRESARTLGFHVPELEEVLALTRGRIGLDIELKEEGYEREIIRLAVQSLAEGDFIVSSFHAGSLARVKQCRAAVRTGLIFKDAGALTTAILGGNTDWLLPARDLAEDELLERMSRSGKKIAVWTVNDIRQMKRLLKDDRIEGIITDRTDDALAVRAGGETPNG
jgi:glycerophosphoryl diester phosphodiesterase